MLWMWQDKRAHLCMSPLSNLNWKARSLSLFKSEVTFLTPLRSWDESKEKKTYTRMRLRKYSLRRIRNDIWAALEKTYDMIEHFHVCLHWIFVRHRLHCQLATNQSDNKQQLFPPDTLKIAIFFVQWHVLNSEHCNFLVEWHCSVC